MIVPRRDEAGRPQWGSSVSATIGVAVLIVLTIAAAFAAAIVRFVPVSQDSSSKAASLSVNELEPSVVLDRFLGRLESWRTADVSWTSFETYELTDSSYPPMILTFMPRDQVEASFQCRKANSHNADTWWAYERKVLRFVKHDRTRIHWQLWHAPEGSEVIEHVSRSHVELNPVERSDVLLAVGSDIFPEALLTSQFRRVLSEYDYKIELVDEDGAESVRLSVLITDGKLVEHLEVFLNRHTGNPLRMQHTSPVISEGRQVANKVVHLTFAKWRLDGEVQFPPAKLPCSYTYDKNLVFP